MVKSNCFCQKSKLPNSQILTKLLQRYTQQELADIYGVNEKTVRRKLKPSNKTKQKRGQKLKITGGTLTLLLSLTSYCSKYNTLTQLEMAKLLYKKRGVLVSQQTISRTLIRKNRTRKKIHPRYQEQDLNQIRQFQESIKHLSLNQFSAIDECNFHLNEAPRYGYAPRGKKAISRSPGSKGGSYSLIIWAASKERRGIVHYELIEKGVNTKKFHDFLANANVHFEDENYLLLDNASIHRAYKKRKELGLPTIEEQLLAKKFIPTYLPSHSPQFNPIEPIINVVRHNIEKTRAWTFERLKKAVDKEMKRLNNKEDLRKYFKKCLQGNLPKLINDWDFEKNIAQIAEGLLKWAMEENIIDEKGYMIEPKYLKYLL
jgi:DDE superfamily endonuclease